MGREFQIKTITDIEAFKELHPAWDFLIENCPEKNVFLTWEWFYAWLKSYGKNTNIRIITTWEGEELVGLAPFMLLRQRKYGIAFRVLRTLSAPQCDVGGFLIKDSDPGIVAAIIDYLAAHKDEWDTIEFNQFYENGYETKAAIKHITTKGFVSHQTSNRQYYIPYENSWEDYHSSLSKNFRKNLRRCQRDMDELGNYTVRRFSGKNVTWDVIETIIEINRHATYPMIAISEEDRALHKELLESMAEKGWFDVYLLTLNDKPIAYEYGFLYEGRMGDWRVGFDRRTDPTLSVGVFLTMAVMKTGFAEGQREINFLRGDEGYKNDWKPTYREYIHFKAAHTNNPLAMLAFIWLPKIKLFFQNRRQRFDEQ